MLALILVASAYGGVPVALPPGEPVDAWREAASLAGLTPGPVPSDGPWVRLTAGPSAWTIEAHGRDGQLHRTTVAPPTTEAQREDALALGASLVETNPVALATPLLPLVPMHPAPAPAPAPAPDPPARTHPSTPKPSTVATAARPEVEAVPPPTTIAASETLAATESPVPASTAEVDPLVPAAPVAYAPIVLLDDPELSGRHLSPWASASVGGSVRGAPSAELGLSAGVAVPPAATRGVVALGLSLARTTPTSLPSLGERRRFTETSAAARVAWRGPIEAGLAAGVAFRGFSQQDEAVARTRTPFGAADVGWPIALAGAWTLQPTAWAGADLAPTSISIGAADLGHLPPVSAGLSLVVRVSPSAGDPSGRPGGLPAR